MDAIQVDFERGIMLSYPEKGIIFALYRGTRNAWDAWLDVDDRANSGRRVYAPPGLHVPDGVIGRVWRVHGLVDSLGFALDEAQTFDGRCEHLEARWVVSDRLRRRLDLYEKGGVPTTWVWMGMMT